MHRYSVSLTRRMLTVRATAFSILLYITKLQQKIQNSITVHHFILPFVK